MDAPRSWIQLRLTLPAARLEVIETVLFEAGALSVAVEDEGHAPWFEEQVGERHPWRQVRLTALFAAERVQQAILEELRRSVSPEELKTLVFDELPDRDWSRAWMDRWEPRRFGRKLWICPTWMTPPDAGG